MNVKDKSFVITAGMILKLFQSLIVKNAYRFLLVVFVR